VVFDIIIHNILDMSSGVDILEPGVGDLSGDARDASFRILPPAVMKSCADIDIRN
jgi:hypothetical protein